jgi:hypothetical protein
MQSLWVRFIWQTIGIVRYKILELEVEKDHFIFIFILHANKYIFDENSLEILGVKGKLPEGEGYTRSCHT